MYPLRSISHGSAPLKKVLRIPSGSLRLSAKQLETNNTFDESDWEQEA